MRIKIDRFQGMVPQSAPRRLGDYQSVLVQNARLSLHELSPIKAPLPVHNSTLATTIKSIFPLGNFWLVWDTDVDIVKSPIANDVHDRYYFTGDGVPRETTTDLAIGGGPIYPTVSYRLGLPPPETVMTVTPDASGVGTNVERVYVHSFKTQWGEEGPPSAASVAITGKVDDSWDLASLEAAPTNTVAISTLTVSSGVATVTHAANVHCADNEKWTFSGVRSVEDGESILTISTSDIETGLGGISDSKVGIIAFAFNRQSFGTGYIIANQTNAASIRFKVAFTGGDQLWIEGRNALGTVILSMKSSTTYSATGWHYVVASWDLAATTGKMYIDQADVTSTTTFTNDLVGYDFTAETWQLFAGTGWAAAKGYLSGLYVNLAEYADLTVGATLEKFTVSSPENALIDQGSDGSFGTGTQPDIYLNGGWSEFGTNKGSGVFVSPTAVDIADGAGTVPKVGSLTNELNGSSFEVTRVSATVFTVPVASFSSYISGGVSTRDAPLNVSTMTRKIYRSTVGGTYQFVAEQAASITTYADTILDAALGELLPTNDLISPPMNMQGLKALPNGYLVGFSGNELAFSEISKLHAFPQEYRHSFDFEIVGLGIWGSQVMVLTKGSHYLAIGGSPGAMSIDTLDYNQSCVSKRSIVGLEYGVTFPTPNGVAFKGGGEIRNITEPLAEKPDWDLYNPSSMLGAIFDDKYIVFYDSAGTSGNDSGGIILDLLEPGAEWVASTETATAVYYNRADGDLFVCKNNTISKFDGHEVQMQTYFLSKIFQTPQKVSMTVGKVRWTPNTEATAESIAAAYSSGIGAIENDLLPNGQPVFTGSFSGFTPGMFPVTGNAYSNLSSSLEQFPASLTFKLYADGVLIHTESPSDSNLFRIDDDYGRSDEFQFSVTCEQGNVHEVLFGEMPSDLSQA